MMGRETRLLLAVLGVLGGAFVGVLTMKLLVPRPPAGAGPDVDPQIAPVAAQDIVEPPALEPRPRASAFTSRSDPFVTRAAAEVPAELVAEEPAAEQSPAREPDLPAAEAAPVPEATPVAPADMLPLPAEPVRASATAPAPIGAAHVTAPGDTWWSIAERAYGDGRLYRALYAWNRRLDPRVTITPGTQLDVPPRPKLAAAWPRLMP